MGGFCQGQAILLPDCGLGNLVADQVLKELRLLGGSKGWRAASSGKLGPLVGAGVGRGPVSAAPEPLLRPSEEVFFCSKDEAGS